MRTVFRDRAHAGQVLASHLQGYACHPDALVLALPRGGVPVAYEVAHALGLPLDVFVVRKLGVPGREELAMGAIASGGVRIVNEALVGALGIASDEIERVTAAQRTELARRERAYRGDRPPPAVRDRTILLVDDGMATGASMMAAIVALRQQQPARIVAAVPVAAAATCQEVSALADEMVCAVTPEPFYAVGAWYDHFEQTGDDAIHTLLERRTNELGGAPAPGSPSPSASPAAPPPPPAADAPADGEPPDRQAPPA